MAFPNSVSPRILWSEVAMLEKLGVTVVCNQVVGRTVMVDELLKKVLRPCISG